MAEITTLLVKAGAGDREAQAAVYRFVEPSARKIARAMLRNRSRGPDFETMVLVDDAFASLMAEQQTPWADRSAFLRALHVRIRWILADYLRKLRTAKRGGRIEHLGLDAAEGLPNDDVPAPEEAAEAGEFALALVEELENLGRLRPDYADVIRMKWFLRLGNEAIAERMGVSAKTVANYDRGGRLLLFEWLQRRGFAPNGLRGERERADRTGPDAAD